MINQSDLTQLKAKIASFPDFPIKGIVFRDLNPIYKDPKAFSLLMDAMKEDADKLGSFDFIAAIEARGFILGSILAQKMSIGFIPVRKKGKLPGKTSFMDYDLEYGKDILEIQADEKLKNTRILIIDDVFATGGTMKAVIKLFEKFTPNIAFGVAYDIGISDIKSVGKKYFFTLPPKEPK